MQVHEIILARRSIRRFTQEDVTAEQVRVLLQAAMAAPSANNRRPWHFIVVRDQQLRQQLARTHQWSYMAAEAPVVFVVCGEPSASDHWVEDTSAATQNLLLQATAMGLGSVWVAIYPRPEREEHVRRVLSIPDHVRVLCLVPVGHPAEQKPPRTQYEETRVHYDRW